MTALSMTVGARRKIYIYLNSDSRRAVRADKIS